MHCQGLYQGGANRLERIDEDEEKKFLKASTSGTLHFYGSQPNGVINNQYRLSQPSGNRLINDKATIGFLTQTHFLGCHFSVVLCSHLKKSSLWNMIDCWLKKSCQNVYLLSSPHGKTDMLKTISSSLSFHGLRITPRFEMTWRKPPHAKY